MTIIIKNPIQQTKHQHTVPKCYLKNFSPDGNGIYQQIKKSRKTNEEVQNELKKMQSLKSATVVENFYTVKNAREPMMVETMFYAKEIENHYPRVYDILTDPSRTTFNMQERTRIIMCLLSLHCRTPKQFQLFFHYVKDSVKDEVEMQNIHEDYKAMHLQRILSPFIEAHEYKIIRVVKIKDTSQFITSDNPVLIVNHYGHLVNHLFREQFNIDNKIIIPLDTKHCCILTNATDRNGIPLYKKTFYNKIERVDVDCTFTQNSNLRMVDSADKYFFGSKEYLEGFFSLVKLA